MTEENNILTPLCVTMNDNYIEFRVMEDDNLIYKSEINSIIPDSAMSVQNIEFPIPSYYLNLKDFFGTTLFCGNIVNTFFTILKSQIDNCVIIVDFNEIEEISTNFCSQYYKYLLTTKNKIITINQNTNVSNMFAQFVLSMYESEEHKDELYIIK